MALDRILLWMSVISSGLLLFRLGRAGFAQGRSFLAVAVAVLAVAAVSEAVAPQIAGWATGFVWAIGLLAPLFAWRLMLTRQQQQRYASARRYAELAVLLHPSADWRPMPELLRALERVKQGGLAEARAALRRLGDDPTLSPRIRFAVVIQQARLTGDWAAVQPVAEALEPLDAEILAARLRALGETGRLHELVSTFELGRERLAALPAQAQLLLLAFCGRSEALMPLLAHALGIEADQRAYWIATAELAAGQVEAGRARLSALIAQSKDPLFRLVAERRLQQPVARATEILTAAEWAIVDAAQVAFRPLPTAGSPALASARRGSPVVMALIAANLLVFGLELLQGNGDSGASLLALGAMWPPAILADGEWWRLVAAVFLHLGPVHLGMNMFGLWILGRPVEAMLGRAKTLFVYLCSGVGSMAAVLFLIQRGWMREELLVGASGAIMGMVGAQAAVLANFWRRRRSTAARAQLSNIGLIVMLQVAFDLSTPQVSFAGHAFGLAFGFLLTLLVLPVLPAANER